MADAPAFPQNEHSDRFIDEGSGGMSLRDWFVGQGLAGLTTLPLTMEGALNRARLLHQQADAILQVRLEVKL